MDIVRVLYDCEDGRWSADSPEMPGWLALGDSYDEIRGLAEEGARFYLERDDVSVVHFLPEAMMATAATPGRVAVTAP